MKQIMVEKIKKMVERIHIKRRKQRKHPKFGMSFKKLFFQIEVSWNIVIVSIKFLLTQLEPYHNFLDT